MSAGVLLVVMLFAVGLTVYVTDVKWRSAGLALMILALAVAVVHLLPPASP